jgi:hypothetical protein
MNDWNPMEHQLRFWTPRSPSAKLKARLFPGAEQMVMESPSPFGGRWAWLAPVMGCFLAMMVISGARSNQLDYLSARPATDWVSAVASNQSYAAYIVSGFQGEQNSPRKDPIEWTNGPRPFRAVSSVLLAKTNSLIH